MWFTAAMMKSNNDNRSNRRNDRDEKDSSSYIETQQVRLKRRTRPLTLLCAISCLTLVSIAKAAVYYVDVGSGSDSNSGTSTSSAWAHLPGTVGQNGSGWATIRAGDTVIVKGGTVNNVRVLFDSSHYSGNNSFNSIVIQSGHLASPAWGSGQAVFDGQQVRTGGFMINGDGITVDGFEVREIAAGANPPLDSNTGSCCIGVAYANSITVKRCWLHNAYSTSNPSSPAPSTDNGHGIEMAGGTNFLFYYNHIGPSIQMKGIEPYRSNFGVISNNFFSGISEHCINFSIGENWDICNNLIRHDPPYGPEPSWAIAIDRGVNLDIWNNVIFRAAPASTTENQRGGSGIGHYVNTSNNRIAHNTICFFNDPVNSGSHQTALSLEAGSGYSHTAIVFYNNLVYGNYNSLGPVAYCVATDYTTQNEVKYCDFFSGSTSDTIMDFETSGSDNLQTVANFSPSCGTYSHNVQLDPLLTKGTMPSGLDAQWHPNTAYFQLTASTPSSVKSTGNALSGDSTHGYDRSPGKFSRDILGNTRTGWSMGAYEIGGGGGGGAAPLPPSGLRIASAP
jgi:hypothetical protein